MSFGDLGYLGACCSSCSTGLVPGMVSTIGDLGDLGVDTANAIAFGKARDAFRAALSRGDMRAEEAELRRARFHYQQLPSGERYVYDDDLAFMEAAHRDAAARAEAQASRGGRLATERRVGAELRKSTSMWSFLPGAISDEAVEAARRAGEWRAPTWVKVGGAVAIGAVLLFYFGGFVKALGSIASRRAGRRRR